MCVCVLFALASTCPVYKYRRDKLRPFGLHRMMRKVTEAAIKSLLLLFQQAAVSFSYYIRVEKHVSFTQFWSFSGGGSSRPSLLRCVSFLPGNSRVDARINYWFNGSMTKNVKGGLDAESGAL